MLHCLRRLSEDGLKTVFALRGVFLLSVADLVLDFWFRLSALTLGLSRRGILRHYGSRSANC